MTSRNWYAWNNLMPPKPDDFHVIGEVYVANPGIKAELVYREPQGINPAILQLDLHLIQQPGIWPQAFTWTQARFDKVYCPKESHYTQVEIFHDNQVIETLDVDTVT